MNCVELNTKFQLFCTEEDFYRKKIEALKAEIPPDEVLNIDEAKLNASMINAKVDDLIQGTKTAQKVDAENLAILKKKDDAEMKLKRIQRELKEAEQALQMMTDHKMKAYKALEEGIKAEAYQNMEGLKNKLSNQIDEIGDTLADLMAMEGVVGYQNAYHRMMSGIISGCPFADESRKLDSYRQQVTDRLTSFKESLIKNGAQDA